MQCTMASNLITPHKFSLAPVMLQPATQPDALIAAAFGNRFAFRWISRFSWTTAYFTRSGSLVDLIFNDYTRVIRPTDANTIYKINNSTELGCRAQKEL